ncbi:MAG: glycosyltransferase family 4 protein [Microthrixaceae bacterium]
MSASVLLSTPFDLGLPGVATTAMRQAVTTHGAGCDVSVICSGVLPTVRLPHGVAVTTTLTLAGRSVPRRVVGRRRALDLHDRRSADLLRRDPERFDVVHVWPGACRRTLMAAKELGIPALRESPSAHTATALEESAREQAVVGISLPARHAFADNPEKIRREEEEYELAHAVVAPSDYVVDTFMARGFPREHLLRDRYGFDPATCAAPRGPDPRDRPEHRFTAVFVGRCEPTKGLHYALDAWHRSGAAASGRFIIVGDWVPGYAEALQEQLDHPSVELRPFTAAVGPVMREADVLVLASVTEGSALVTYEAQACGTSLLVSDHSGAVMTDGVQGMVHPARDVDVLTTQLAEVHRDPDLRRSLRTAALAARDDLTWDAAGRDLAALYLAVTRAAA